MRYVDPYGHAWYDWQWIDTAANWGAGLGDHLSFGFTDWARDGYGLNDVVDKCRGAYAVGTATGMAFDLATTGGSLALSKSAGRATAKQLKNDRRVGRKVLDLVKGDGKEAHHVNPLKGHPPIKGERGGPPTIFPTGGLPSWLRNHPMNLQALDEAGHAAAHARVRGAEKVARAMGLADPYASAIRGGLSAGRLSGGCD